MTSITPLNLVQIASATLGDSPTDAQSENLAELIMRVLPRHDWRSAALQSNGDAYFYVSERLGEMGVYA